MVRLFTQETVEGGDEAVEVLDVEQVAAVRDKVEGTLLETGSRRSRMEDGEYPA